MGRERIVDTGVVAFAAALGLTGSVPRLPAFAEPYDAVYFGLVLLGAASLWFRRRAPIAVAWFAVALGAVLVVAAWTWPLAPGAQLEPENAVLPAAAPFAAYGLTAFTRASWLPLAVLAVVACLGAPPGPHSLAAAVLAAALVGGPAVLGRYVAARAERAAALREQARKEERLRLAAEIHDVVSHRVSAMVLQAGALQLTTSDDASRLAADQLRATGCLALDELRELVGLLNATDGTGPLAPLPDLSTLVGDTEVVVSGEPRPLSPVVGRTAYRVVQESLTNARKHAPGARVRVEIAYLPGGLRVSVDNTAPTGPATGVTGGGTGLLGLRRRIELLDGTLRAEPHAGGFRVDASLPLVVGR